MTIDIGSVGYNHIHEKNFHQNMPAGPGTYLFLLIKSPAIFIINGNRIQVLKNSYVILQPHTPSDYLAAKENYIDDWFYFGMNDKDKDFLQELGILFDQPVHLNDIEELSSLIHRIAFELFSSDPFHTEIKNLYTQIFFYELSRIITTTEVISQNTFTTKNEKLTYLRTKIFQEPSAFQNIDDMAEFMHLSRSGFQHLYSKVFGRNVMQDVISGRIERAKELLRTTKFTISEIAAKCGYKTEYHFMRQFKEKTGLTPTEFRNGNTWQQIDDFWKNN